MKTTLTLAICVALSTTAVADTGDAMGSAFDSAFGEPKTSAEIIAEGKATYEAMKAASAAKKKAVLDAYIAKIQAQLAAQAENELPPITLPEPEEPAPKDDHLTYGYDDEGGPIGLEEWEEGYVGFITGRFGNPYTTLKAACESFVQPEYLSDTEVGYTAYGRVGGAYAEDSHDIYVSPDEALIGITLENNDTQIKCWNKRLHKVTWEYVGTMTVGVQDVADCEVRADDEPYEFHLGVSDTSVIQHVQIDLDGDGIPDNQHSLIDQYDEGGVPTVIHSGLGADTETLTYDSLNAIVPTDMQWDGTARMRYFGVSVIDGEEVRTSVVLDCVYFGDL